jgi:hypothetical protein
VIRLLRKLLARIYGFDQWHVSSYLDRPYAHAIVGYVNSRPAAGRESLVEIGCGLGDIVRRARYAQRTGLDRDPRLFRPAQLLATLRAQRGIDFARFEFPGPLQGRHDVIVLVNWIHNIEPDVLAGEIETYARQNLRGGGEIVVDTVADPAYRINHAIEQLTMRLACDVTRIGEFSRGREVWAIRPSDGS